MADVNSSKTTACHNNKDLPPDLDRAVPAMPVPSLQFASQPPQIIPQNAPSPPLSMFLSIYEGACLKLSPPLRDPTSAEEPAHCACIKYECGGMGSYWYDHEAHSWDGWICISWCSLRPRIDVYDAINGCYQCYRDYRCTAGGDDDYLRGCIWIHTRDLFPFLFLPVYPSLSLLLSLTPPPLSSHKNPEIINLSQSALLSLAPS